MRRWLGIGHHLALLCLAGASLTSACIIKDSPPRDPREYAEHAHRDYEIALDAFYDHDWEYAKELMQEVRRNYGYSRYARLAEFRLADIDYYQGNFMEAVGSYKSFVHDYPNDPEVAYASYRIAVGQYNSVGESMLLPPLEERDLASVEDAYRSLKKFVRDFPGYEKEAELKYMLEVVRGVLARHELYVARFYLGQGKFDPAVARARYAVDEYGDSGLEPEALVLLGEIYLKMKRLDQARAVLTAVIERYPASAFTVPAKRFLAQRFGKPAANKAD